MNTFTFNAAELQKNISNGTRLCTNRTVMPITESVLFIAKKNGDCLFTSTNIDDYITVKSTFAQNEFENNFGEAEEISFCVDGCKLRDYVNTLKTDRIKFNYDSENKQLVVAHGGGKFKLPTLAASEFPERKMLSEKTQTFKMRTSDIIGYIKNAGNFVSSNELQQILCTINFKKEEDGYMRICATDAHKLNSEKFEFTDINTDDDLSFSIHSRCLSIIANAFADNNDELTFSITTNDISIFDKNCGVKLSCIEGKYPNINSIIPKYGENDFSFKTSKEAMKTALRRAMLSTTKTQCVVLNFTQSNVIVSSENAELSLETKEEVAGFGTATLAIGFNGQFLNSVLNACTNDTITFHATAPNRPVVVSEEESGMKTLLLMPVLIQ